MTQLTETSYSAETVSPHIFKTGGGVMVAGVWIALVGIGLAGLAAAVALGAWGFESPLVVRAGLLVFASAALGFAAVGTWLTFGGERITLDPANRRIDIAHGRWWTWKRETRAMDDYWAVQVHCRSVTVGADSAGQGNPCYPVSLMGHGEEIEVACASRYHKARATAERVAQCLNLPLHDATESETVVREAPALDESLAERAARLGEDVRWPVLPRTSRIDVGCGPTETVIDLPRVRGKLLREGVIGLAFLLALYGGAMYALGRFGQTFVKQWFEGGVATAVVWAAVCVPVAYLLAFGLILLLTRERIVVSQQALMRVWRLPLLKLRKRLAVREIEEIVSNTDAVIVRTDRTKCQLGFAVDKKERQWLRQALRYLLVKGPR